jgi:hypothetical protein
MTPLNSFTFPLGEQKYATAKTYLEDEIYEDAGDADDLLRLVDDFIRDPSDVLLGRLQQELDGWGRQEADRFIDIIAAKLPPDAGDRIRSSRGSSGFWTKLVVGLLCLTTGGARQIDPCKSLKLTIDREPYDSRNPRHTGAAVREACEVIKELGKGEKYALDTSLVDKKVRQYGAGMNGEFLPESKEISLYVRPMDSTSRDQFRSTVRHEQRHHQVFVENETLGELSANPCFSYLSSEQSACEERILAFYGKLAEWHTLKPEQQEAFMKFAPRLAGQKFTFALTSVDGLEKRWGKGVLTTAPQNKGLSAVVTIPREPERARLVLWDCLATWNSLDMAVYKNKFLEERFDTSRMAAEIEAKLVGHLGLENTRELFRIVDPRLAELLDKRDKRKTEL